MAKELPYFRFEPSEWQNGNIQMFDNATKIAFIEICCTYWQRLGNISYAFALQKHCNGNPNVIDSLIDEDIISLEDDKIVIDFLDEQFDELTLKSKKAAESANKRWNKKKKNANAMRTHSEGNANRIDKNRKDKNRKDKISSYSEDIHNCFKYCEESFSADLRPQNDEEHIKWLDTIEKLNRLDKITLKQVYSIVKFATEDEFWKSNFLSITKLRRKNKEKIPYWKVFLKQIESNGTNKQHKGNSNNQSRESAFHDY